MEINSVTDNYVLPTPPASKGSSLDQEAFLKLLVVQLSTQDPLSPMTDRDFFAQLAQLGTVQGIEGLKKSNELAQASAMLGKVVDVYSDAKLGGVGAQVDTGVVQAAEVRNGKVVLRVNGNEYALDKVLRIYS
ncbi:MAG: flagellar hook capping FlgD N-terminal domain-containing protein [Fimbriimonadales bacterium]